MPNPKRRHSKHRKRIRRAHDALASSPVNYCPRCGSAKRPHRVCDNCGHYGFAKGGQKGEEILPKEEFSLDRAFGDALTRCSRNALPST